MKVEMEQKWILVGRESKNPYKIGHNLCKFPYLCPNSIYFLQTPLHLAVRDNSIEIIEILLAFGANPSIRDFRGNTCLHMATAIRSSESLKLLAESVTTKEELNVFNNFGK